MTAQDDLRESARLLDASEERVHELVRALWVLADWPAEKGNFDMREYARRTVEGEPRYAEDVDGGLDGPVA